LKEHLDICREEDDVVNIMDFNTANYDSDEDEEDVDDVDPLQEMEYAEGAQLLHIG